MNSTQTDCLDFGDQSQYVDSNAQWDHFFREQLTSEEDVNRTVLRNRHKVYDDVWDDDDVWSKRIVLSFDGGGIRGLSTLIILRELMKKIRIAEQHPDLVPASSSGQSPQIGRDQEQQEMKRLRKAFDLKNIKTDSERQTDDFLPCHYFDYIAGTSTGAGL